MENVRYYALNANVEVDESWIESGAIGKIRNRVIYSFICFWKCAVSSVP